MIHLAHHCPAFRSLACHWKFLIGIWEIGLSGGSIRPNLTIGLLSRRKRSAISLQEWG